MLVSKSKGVEVTLLEGLVSEKPRVSEGHILHLCTQEISVNVNTLRTGDADLHFYITTVQDG